MTKICAICLKEKDLDCFSKSTQRKDGRGSYCKPCDNERKKKWNKENPEKFRDSVNKARKKFYENNPEYAKQQEKRRDFNRRLRKFGLTKEEYDRMANKCNNLCMICGLKTKYSLAIDHCHKTNKVRGLLCSNCNTALGLVKDSEDILNRMIKYLKGELK